MTPIDSETCLSDLKNEHNVLVAYFAPPTCNVGESIQHKVDAAGQSRGVAVGHVDTASHPAIAGQHLVLAYPTILVFVFGREFQRFSRIISMGDLEEALDRALAIVADADD